MDRVSIKRLMTASRVGWVGGHMVKEMPETWLGWSLFWLGCGGGVGSCSDGAAGVISGSDILRTRMGFGDSKCVREHCVMM